MIRRENAQRRRRSAHREPRARLLIVCGGEVTEPGYFIGLGRAHRGVRLKIEKKGKDPASLVEYAAAIRRRYSELFDEVWCVVDVDQFDLSTARRQAEMNAVRLAISNPCFEVWLLLHFVDCRSPVQSAAEAVRRLKRHVPDYSKHELRFDRFEGGVADAITRAQGLGEIGEEHMCNPSTGVWMVVDAVIGDGLNA